jgi:ribosome-associated translation inhibitor RaiA
VNEASTLGEEAWARELLPCSIMQVPLQITFHGLAHSDPVERYVRLKAEKLDATSSRLTSCRVALELPHRHSVHGEHYRVSIDVAVPGGEIVVSHSPEHTKPYADLYATIDLAFGEASRQLHEFARKRREAAR